MTAFDYGRSLSTANRLITRFGQAGLLRRRINGVDTDYPITFVVTDYRSFEVDGTRIAATDKKILMSVGSLPVLPVTSDRLVEADGGIYKIKDIEPLKPGTTVLLWTVQGHR